MDSATRLQAILVDSLVGTVLPVIALLNKRANGMMLLANSWGVLSLTSRAKHLRSLFVTTNLHYRANASPLPANLGV
jgi:hypothetical protein